MEKPLKLFLGHNKDYVPVSIEKRLNKISEIAFVKGYDLQGIIAGLDQENEDKPLHFEIKPYGATVELKQQMPLVVGNYLPSVEGKELVRCVQELFNQATSYAVKHNSDFVLIQNLDINLVSSKYNPTTYELKGLVQLFLR